MINETMQRLHREQVECLQEIIEIQKIEIERISKVGMVYAICFFMSLIGICISQAIYTWR